MLAFSVVTERLTATRHNSPVYPLGRNIVGPLLRILAPSWGIRCHPPPMPRLDRAATSPESQNPNNDPARLRHPREHQPPDDAATDASAAPCRHRAARPWVRRFSVHPATTTQCSSSSVERDDRHALRLLPGPRYMPQSVLPVGLANSLCPQNNSTRICFF